ncbi:hypothetical protein [Trabulsiella guamensis]|nr:hypothetical protein [Trabulsiella guamensis]
MSRECKATSKASPHTYSGGVSDCQMSLWFKGMSDAAMTIGINKE